ncbi:DNA adenine methylase [Denitratimonas sp. CY0512]|uniref:DNA adenine methylase n=1 Tax=Denitratimonas sp. CY0512 TaxID=3131940 RepID=UPI0030966913
MKYMGSKRAMLKNGLGELLKEEALSASRIVDLFSGSASVSWFSATRFDIPVEAYDLQSYAVVMAQSVISRDQPVSIENVEKIWIDRSRASLRKMNGWKESIHLEGKEKKISSWKKSAEKLCSSGIGSKSSIIFNRYGGHYFSPTQALAFDSLLRNLPEDEVLRSVCLSATIVAASQCSASPGHTAQPFKATKTAAPFLLEAWSRDPFFYVTQAVKKIAPLHAKKIGKACVKDSNEVARNLLENDLVFVDPPYSGVHYSRFYHVLETIARGQCGQVSGIGRYPPSEERPNSAYSKRGTSRDAIEDLLKSLSDCGCTVILTFPKGECSNGLAGEDLEELANNFFNVSRRVVKTRFSTLGGNDITRSARKTSDELILVLKK